MSHQNFLERLAQHGDRDAVVWRDQAYSYAQLLQRIERIEQQLLASSLEPASVVLVEADYSLNSIAALLVLLRHRCIVVPVSSTESTATQSRIQIARCQLLCQFDEQDGVHCEPLACDGQHELYAELRRRKHPGLVLFSSGSTGESKGVVHDFSLLLERYRDPRPALRTAAFLLYDHIGGMNTLLHTLANGGCVIALEQRTPDHVLEAVQRHRIELLPTSPTFLNLVLISEAYRRYDLSSLQLITYGTEPMPESTLRRLREVLPEVRLAQTYGLSEVGILKAKSLSSDSLWVKLGGEGFETRIVDGMLEIKARSAMLGYLNAPSPFTEDGWLRTGDRVLVDGEYVRILGRDSELINVGGQKVYPAEVEGVLQELEGVESVVVRGEPNPLLGQVVTALVHLNCEESLGDFRRRMRAHCATRLAPFKIPQKVVLTDQPLHNSRFKKIRRLP